MKTDSSFSIDGARLSAARIDAGMSLVEAGLVLKRNKGTISKWERGINRPDWETAQRLALLYKRNDFIVKEGVAA